MWRWVLLAALGCGSGDDVTETGGETDTDTDVDTDADSDTDTDTDTTDPCTFVWEGDLVLEEDADAAAMAGTCEITGNVVIKQGTIATLAGLESVATIGGNLDLTNNTYLTNVDGLSGLTNVDGRVNVGATQIQQIDGLSGLTTIGGDLDITANPNLCQSAVDSFFDTVTVGGVKTSFANGGC